MKNYIEKIFTYVEKPDIEKCVTRYAPPTCGPVYSTFCSLYYYSQYEQVGLCQYVPNTPPTQLPDGSFIYPQDRFQYRVYEGQACSDGYHYDVCSLRPGGIEVAPILGWNAGANSLEGFYIGDTFVCKPSLSSAGLAIGVTTIGKNKGYYKGELIWGFYIRNGSVRMITDNQIAPYPSEAVTFKQGDVFSITRTSTNLIFKINGVVYANPFYYQQGGLIIDLSMYASGDRVEDAEIKSGTQFLTIYGTSKMEAGMGASVKIFGTSRIESTVVTAASSEAEFQPLDIESSDYDYANTEGVFPALKTECYADDEIISYGSVTPYFGGIYADATGFNHAPGQVDSNFKAMQSLSSGDDGTLPIPYAYAQAKPKFAALKSVSYPYPIVDAALVGYASGASLYSEGVNSGEVFGLTNGFVPPPTLYAKSGESLDGKLPTVSLNVEATVANVGRVDGPLPKTELWVEAYFGTAGRLFGQAATKMKMTAFAGASLQKDLPLSTLIATGQTGQSGSTDPRTNKVAGFSLLAEATMEDVASLVGNVPLVTTLYGEMVQYVPTTSLRAIGYAEVTTLDVYSMNIENNSISEYQNFDFSNIVKVNDVYCGVKSDGLYELSGDDDELAQISASFETVPLDFDNIQLKNVSHIYITARTDSLFTCQSSYDEQYSTIYNSANMFRENPYNWRVKQGRGLQGIYWGHKISNVEGSDFQIQSFSNYYNILSRRR